MLPVSRLGIYIYNDIIIWNIAHFIQNETFLGEGAAVKAFDCFCSK